MARRKKAQGGDGRTTYSDDNRTTAEILRSYLERIERLEEEKGTINDDIKDIKGEVKSRGFDLKAFNQILKERKQDRDERLEFEAILDTYRAALGMLAPDRETDDDGEGVV